MSSSLTRWAVSAIALSSLAACASGGSGTLPSTGPDAPAATGHPAERAVRTSSAATAPAYASEQAKSVASFVDSIGINVHLSEPNSPYTANVSNFVDQVKALGVHHLRDGMLPGQTGYCQTAQQFAKVGVDFDYIVSVGASANDIKTWAACAGSAVGSFEGANEYDLMHPSSDSNWAASVAAAQKLLYATVTGTPSLAQYPVLGPSFTSPKAFTSVGDLSSAMTYGNMHAYFAGRNPGTTGWGDDGYGSINYNQRVVAPTDGTRQIVTTETGYGTADGGVSPGGSNLIPAVAAKYFPRLAFEMFNNGIKRSYIYEMYDEGTGGFSTYGLVNASSQPRAQYYALQKILAEFENHGPANANPGKLAYSLGGQTANVHHTLMQRADGAFVLALWLEGQDEAPDAGTSTPIAPQNVTLNFPTAPQWMGALAFDANGDFPWTSFAASTSVPVTVTDSIQLVEFHV